MALPDVVKGIRGKKQGERRAELPTIAFTHTNRLSFAGTVKIYSTSRSRRPSHNCGTYIHIKNTWGKKTGTGTEK